MRIRWHYAVLAILLSMLTWYVVIGREDVDSWLPVAIEYINTPKDVIISGHEVSKIEVHIRAPRGMIQAMYDKKLTYPINLGELQPGINNIVLKRNNLPFSSSYEVLEITPQVINLNLEKRVVRKVPVEIDFQGRIDQHYEVKSMFTVPKLVEISGSYSDIGHVKKLEVIVNEDFRKENNYKAWKKELPVSIAKGAIIQPRSVIAHVDFKEKMTQVWVKVPIKITGKYASRIEANVNFVRLHLKGPSKEFTTSKYRDDIKVEFSMDRLLREGKYNLRYDVKIPKGFILLEKNPAFLEILVK